MPGSENDACYLFFNKKMHLFLAESRWTLPPTPITFLVNVFGQKVFSSSPSFLPKKVKSSSGTKTYFGEFVFAFGLLCIKKFCWKNYIREGSTILFSFLERREEAGGSRILLFSFLKDETWWSKIFMQKNLACSKMKKKRI